jgi:Ser/Thr protein kinase RdoA (MazF antagonist)
VCQIAKSATGRFCLEHQGKYLTVSPILKARRSPLSSDLDPLETLGHTLANLHLIGRSYKKGIDNRFSFNRILSIYKEVRRQLPSHLKNIIRVLDDEFSYLENYLDNNLPKGIIHGDLFPDNVKFKGGRLVGVMDFEAACRENWYSISPLRSTLLRRTTLSHRSVRSFDFGYESLRPLSLPEWDSFPNELRFSALRLPQPGSRTLSEKGRRESSNLQRFQGITIAS